MERTFIILKPDAVKRKLIGQIISRFENKNYIITHMKLSKIDRSTANIHYQHVQGLPIYEEMLDYITSGPSLMLILEGDKVISTVRNMVGKTSSHESPPGTIRGDYGSHRFQNLIHASDSTENAEMEIKRFFPELQ